MLRRHCSIVCLQYIQTSPHTHICVFTYMHFICICMYVCLLWRCNFLEKVLAKMARECQARGRAEIYAAVLEYAGAFPLSYPHLPLPPHTHELTHTNNVCSPYRTIAADAALYRFTPISDKSFAVVVVLVVVVSLPVLPILVLLLIISLYVVCKLLNCCLFQICYTLKRVLLLSV